MPDLIEIPGAAVGLDLAGREIDVIEIDAGHEVLAFPAPGPDVIEVDAGSGPGLIEVGLPGPPGR